MVTPLVQGLPPFYPDITNGASVGPRWKTWLADFETFVIVNDITDDKRKRALLLYQASSRVCEIFRQLQDTGEDKDYKKAVEKFNEYFEPQKNKLYEVYEFRQAKQQEGETIDHFHTHLRSLSQTCEFADASLDFEIMVQIVIGGCSSRLRKQALRDPKMTLKDLFLEGRCEELSEFQASKNRFSWPKMTLHIKGFVRNCQVCAKTKLNPQYGKAPSQPIIVKEPFIFWALDYMGALPETFRGNRHLLVVMDHVV